MVQLDTAFVKGIPGILKIVTLILGVICLGLTADSYVKMRGEEKYFGGTVGPDLHGHETEVFYVVVVVLMFIMSLVWFLLFLLSFVKEGDVKIPDIIYHVIGGVLLLIGSIVWIVTVNKYKKFETTDRNGNTYTIYFHEHYKEGKEVFKPQISKGYYLERVFAVVFGFINAIVYIVVAIFLFIKK